jgi:hypothetical protein
MQPVLIAFDPVTDSILALDPTTCTVIATGR